MLESKTSHRKHKQGNKSPSSPSTGGHICGSLFCVVCLYFCFLKLPMCALGFVFVTSLSVVPVSSVGECKCTLPSLPARLTAGGPGGHAFSLSVDVCFMSSCVLSICKG